jgi:hypothetical protein
MTASEPAAKQTSEDDTALLVAALNHYWTWLDGRFNRAFQIINYYLVATAILFTAYISAINGKHYGIAAALALVGRGLTAPMALAVLGEVIAGARAAPGLMELHNRMASRLRIEPIHLAAIQAGRTQRRVGVAITLGLSSRLEFGGLLYALIH